MEKNKRKHRRKAEIHLIPDALGVAAGAALVGPEVGMIVNLWENGAPPWSQYGPFGPGATGETIQNLKDGAVPAAYFAAGAVAAKYVGKWLGLNRIGTKKVKLF